MVKGTYALVLALSRETTLKIGKRGVFRFPPGYYAYVGSAQGGLFQRIGRHLKQNKTLRWHIDYLAGKSRVVEVWYAADEQRLECDWRQSLSQMSGALPFARGFGSSDCRCWSHLLHFSSMPSFEMFQEKAQSRGIQVNRTAIGGVSSEPQRRNR